MSTHLDLDGLADLLAGEGADDDVRHVSRCARCSAALADVEEAQTGVRRALAALPEPAVPGDLAARLDAALLQAREQELDAAPDRQAVGTGGPDRQAAGDPAQGATTVVPRRRSRAAPRGNGLLVAAGVAAVLVVGGGAVVAQRALGPGGGADGAAESAAAAPAAPRTSTTGTDYTSADRIRAALPGLLDGSAPDAGRPSPDPLARLREPAALADCLAGLAGPGTDGVPLALDHARWDGAPALVVVLPSASPQRVDVFVVGEGCRSGDEQTRLFTQLPRPS